MAEKPTYEELEQRVNELEGKSALRDKTEGLLKALRVAGIGFLDWNLKTNEIFLSDEAYRLYGLKPDKALNKTELITKIVHPDNLVYVQNNFDLAVHEGKRYSIEHRIMRPDGKVLWVHAKIQLTCDADGKPETLLGTIVDITGRKQAEEALRESAMKFRTFADFTYDWESWIGPDGKYIYISPACERITGYSPHEFIKDPGLLEKITHPEDRKLVSKHIHDYSDIEKVMDIDFRIITSSGETRWISHVCQPVHDNDGNWLGRRTSNRDITHQRELEAQLQHTKKMEAVGTLAGGMAHEFNNLMTAVLSYSSFLLTDLGQDDPMRKDVEEIRKAGKRASSLVKQLLAFSRKQVLQPAMLDLNSLLTDKEEMLRHLIGEDVELKMVPEQDLGRVKADPRQMEQVILNLAVNARDAMSQGGKLTIETANVELDEFYVSTHGDELKPGPYVMLAMSDTGMGMDKETLSQVFEPFFTTKDTGQGTGLGLSTVYGIVKQSSGDIRVYSEPEKGTIFKIYLPRMEEDVESLREVLEQ
ncbi:MAG: PAS domain-containing protein [Proteobacteria bacterium]|nr:PAS domain-containing protein [Pseudomonadota bacterium]